MTTVDGVTAGRAAGAETSGAATQAAASLDYDAFLTLLVAQMQNQDPLNPVDSTEYVSQLASFSTVEQAIKTNAKLDSLLTSMSLAQGAGLIGRTASSADGRVTGVIESVRIGREGATADLTGGGSLRLGEGVTIS
ncbi:MAG: flagellar hook assembly protein FlgD [Hyphomicrobiales bacterium]|nr:flagellar hook assembly protein FlgD [Hyphomicrobiales bacterium]